MQELWRGAGVVGGGWGLAIRLVCFPLGSVICIKNYYELSWIAMGIIGITIDYQELVGTSKNILGITMVWLGVITNYYEFICVRVK